MTRNHRVFFKSWLVAAAVVIGADPAMGQQPGASVSPSALLTQAPALPAPMPAPAPGVQFPQAAQPIEQRFAPEATATLLGIEPPPRFEGLPNSLLWEPLIASKRDPRFSITGTSHEDALSQDTNDTYIGGTFPILRISPPDRPYQIQIDSFGVVASRWSRSNYLVALDYRAGIPITFSSGCWSGKFGWEHTSTHLGDETMVRTGVRPIDYEKDELVTALSYVFDNSVRVYGLVGWAFYLDVPGDPSAFRYDVGCEIFNRGESGRWGQPFAALNVEFNGDVDFKPNFTAQVGWMWRKPEQRLGQVRIFGEYYTGHSPYGQLFLNKESAWALGVSLDY